MTETLTGAGSTGYTGQGGTSSFGSHCSATGGNSGYSNTNNEGSTSYGIGGMGVGGDENARGGRGGDGTTQLLATLVAVETQHRALWPNSWLRGNALPTAVEAVEALAARVDTAPTPAVAVAVLLVKAGILNSSYYLR